MYQDFQWTVPFLEDLLRAAQFDITDLQRLKEYTYSDPTALFHFSLEDLRREPFSLSAERAECFIRCRDRMFQKIRRTQNSSDYGVTRDPVSSNVRRLRKDGKYFYSTPKQSKRSNDNPRMKSSPPPGDKRPGGSKSPQRPGAANGSLSTLQQPSQDSTHTPSSSLPSDDRSALSKFVLSTPKKASNNNNRHAQQHRKIHAQLSTLMEPIDAIELPIGTNLNESPQDWPFRSALPRSVSEICETSAEDVTRLLVSSPNMADVVCFTDQLAKLLLSPMGQQDRLSLRVFRVGQTLILDEPPATPYLSTVKESHSEALLSKFIYHSMDESESKQGMKREESTFSQSEMTTSEDPTSSLNLCSRTITWKFKDVRVLLGVKDPIFQDALRDEETFLKLKEMDNDTLRFDELWIENILSNVHRQKIGWHQNGILHHYENLSTAELSQKLGLFDVSAVEDLAGRMLRWLQKSCSTDLSTYELLFDPARPNEFNLMLCYRYEDRPVLTDSQSDVDISRDAIFSPLVLGSVYYKEACFMTATGVDDSADSIFSVLKTFINAIHYLWRISDSSEDQSFVWKVVDSHFKCAHLLIRLSGVHHRNLSEENKHTKTLTTKQFSNEASASSIGTGVVEETLRKALQHIQEGVKITRDKYEVCKHMKDWSSVTSNAFRSVFEFADQSLGSSVTHIRSTETLQTFLDIVHSLNSLQNQSESDAANIAYALCHTYISLIRLNDNTNNTNLEEYQKLCIFKIFQRKKVAVSSNEIQSLQKLFCSLQIAMAQQYLKQFRFTKAMDCLRAALAEPKLDPQTADVVHKEVEATLVSQAHHAAEGSAEKMDLLHHAVTLVPNPSTSTFILYAKVATANFKTPGTGRNPRQHLQRALDSLRKKYGSQHDEVAQVEYYLGAICARELEYLSHTDGTQSITLTAGLTHLRRSLDHFCHQCMLATKESSSYAQKILLCRLAAARLQLFRIPSHPYVALEELKRVVPFLENTSVCAVRTSDAVSFHKEIQEMFKKACHTALTFSQQHKEFEAMAATLKKLYLDTVTAPSALMFLKSIP
eukprot:PhF_6_TR26389/c0_g1_i1/m.38082